MPAALPRMKAIRCSTAAAFLWGLGMATTAAAGLYLRGRFNTFHLPAMLTIFFLGGIFGWWLTELVGQWLRHFIRQPRLLVAIAFIGLASATVFCTAALFALEYRSFYAQWHAETLSRIWFLQLIFTSASAFYQFAVMATRLYLPLGPPLLVAGTWIMLRRIR
ncbi:hypothetical protein GAO09_15100 [Rhizobiales bacterium RZME27]|jgi:hypothetical protein|uniref:Transmembrane protein n=1 Tax=Endobacterium cereale TaxID=2663029 RepID=A0A6A8A805_9HYPH|nr:hypothetical protein [Endobacterium cereale]MEB2843532.1 hypothetical protein [Endobacterium cereale]MQY47363.1 hypothetical protein [Endobacterium cereale]